MSPEDLMLLAIEQARLALAHDEVPIGAVVYHEPTGRVIGRGHNRRILDRDPTAHAEVIAIRRACAILKSFQLEGCDLYTSCEPCPMCLGAIYWARPARIFFGGTHKDAAEFGFDDSFIYQQARLPVDQRHIPMKQLLGAEALAGFMEWQRSTAKILY